MATRTTATRTPRKRNPALPAGTMCATFQGVAYPVELLREGATHRVRMAIPGGAVNGRGRTLATAFADFATQCQRAEDLAAPGFLAAWKRVAMKQRLRVAV